MNLSNRSNLVVVVLALWGCQDTPRNGAVITTPKVTYSGFSTAAGVPVTLQIRDQSASRETWVTLATTTTNTGSTKDSQGVPWSSFSRDVTLPAGRNDTKFWKSAAAASGQRRIAAETRSSSSGEGVFNTFDVSDQACIDATQDQGGFAIIEECNSEGEHAATVLLNCGRSGQSCCLGNGLNATASCDSGLLCNTANNTCSISMGGINQPCFVGGAGCTAAALPGHSKACLPDPAAPWPATGMCRDTTVERAPVLTSEIVLHTCDATNAESSTDKWVALTPGLQYGNNYYLDVIPLRGMFWLHKSGDNLRRNATDTYGVWLDSVQTLGDIDRIMIGINGGDHANDGWCFDRVTLNVNGVQVFSKSISGGITLDRDTGVQSVTVATKDELRRAYAALNRPALCGLPTGITYTQLDRQVEGLYGDTIVRTRRTDEEAVPDAHKFKVFWGDGGVTVTRASSGAAKIHMQFRMQEFETGLDFEATVKVDIEARMSCDFASEGHGADGVPQMIDWCSTDFQSPFVLTSVTVDADTSLPIAGVIESKTREMVINATIDQLDSFVGFDTFFDGAEALACRKMSPVAGQLCDPDGELCGCPGITFSTTGIQMVWTHFGPNGTNLMTAAPADSLCLR